MSPWLTSAIAVALAVILVIMIAVHIQASISDRAACSRLGTGGDGADQTAGERPYYIANPDTINDPAYWRDPFENNPHATTSTAWNTRHNWAADLELLKCPVVADGEASQCLYECVQVWRMHVGIPISFGCQDAQGFAPSYSFLRERWTSSDSCLMENVALPGTGAISGTSCLIDPVTNQPTIDRLLRSDYVIPNRAPPGPEVDGWGEVCMNVIETQQESYRILAIAITLIVLVIILAAVARLFMDRQH